MSPEIRQLWAMFLCSLAAVLRSLGYPTYRREVPGTVLTPVAHRVQDGPSGGVQRHRHVVVPLVRDHGRARPTFVEAVVVLQVIDAPRRVGLRVNFLESERSELPSTCVPAFSNSSADVSWA